MQFNSALELIRRIGSRLGLGRREDVAAWAFAGCIVLTLGSVARAVLIGPGDFRPKYIGAYIAAGHGDPYNEALVVAEGSHVLHVPTQDLGSYLDPPAFTLLINPLTHLSFASATVIWMTVLVLCALGCGVLVARVLGMRTWGRLQLLMIAAVTLDFAPIRNGLVLGQHDPLVGLLALVGLLLTVRGKPARGGFFGGLALIKPQVSLLALMALAASGGWMAVVGATCGLLALVMIPSLLSWLGLGLGSYGAWFVEATSAAHAAGGYFGLQIAIAIAGIGLIAYGLVQRRFPRNEPLLLYSAAVLLNAIVAPLVYLNPQSEILVLFPLALLVRSWLTSVSGPTPWLMAAVRGFVFGGLFGDSLFAVSYHAGILHAAYPWISTIMLGAGVICLAPRFYREIITALAWNLALTAIPFDPDSYYLVGAGVALVMLMLLSRQAGVLPAGRVRNLSHAHT